jgi:ribosomal protein S18 acetylase RimI-like enzyme
MATHDPPISAANIVCRPAVPADAGALARLVDMAGEGLPFHLWSRMAAPGQDPWAVGRERALRETGGFSYRNTTVLATGDEVLGCLIGYPIADHPAEVDVAGVPPMFVPLLRLEALAAGTWYVNVLAVEPAHRNAGLGARLLALADEIAAANRKSGTSIIVSDGNPGARRLYGRAGYREVAAEPMVKDDWVNGGENWVLMLKP